MSRTVGALRLSIYLGHADVAHHKALSTEILHRAHRAGLAGSSSWHGIEGFGRSAKVHSESGWALIDRAPVLVQIVDLPARIEAFADSLADLADRCLIVCDPVDVLDPATPTSSRE